MGRRKNRNVQAQPPSPLESILDSTQDGGRTAVLDITPCLKNYPANYMDRADTLLVLEYGQAYLSHRAILASHSAVLSDMLTHLAHTSTKQEKLRLPFKDFSELECSMLLEFLYNKTPCFRSQAAAVFVAIFAHKHDAQDSMPHAEAYLISCVKDQFEDELCMASSPPANAMLGMHMKLTGSMMPWSGGK